MTISEREVGILNKLGKHHPDMALLEQPPSKRLIPLGDYVKTGLSTGVVKTFYNFDLAGGTDGTTVDLSKIVPKNAIVTRVYTRVIDAVASSGTPAWSLKAGVILVAIADATALTGIEEHSALVHVPSESKLSLDLSGADITAGKVEFYVEYVLG